MYVAMVKLVTTTVGVKPRVDYTAFIIYLSPFILAFLAVSHLARGRDSGPARGRGPR
jgi:hypothetical protein